MKAIQLSAYGAPEAVVHLVDIPEPGAPDPGQILIDVEAAPIEPSDLYTIMGVYGHLPALPHVLGIQGVGRVSAVGAGVKHLKEGDRVITPPFTPSWASRIKANPAWLRPLPDGDLLQLSMLGINPATAHLILTEFVKLRPGDWVLQNSANSGVGRAIIALARVRGYRTVNIVRREELVSELVDAGADIVLVDGPDIEDRIKKATGNASFAVAFDGVGGAATQVLLDCLPVFGTVVVYSGMSGSALTASPPLLVFRSHSIQAFWIFNYLRDPNPDTVAAMYDDLAPLVAAGTYTQPVVDTYGFHEYVEAINVASQYRGKAIFLPRDTV